jgi:hypothetical protein
MILGTEVFKTRIGNAPHVSRRVSLALVGMTIWSAPTCSKLQTISPDSRVCFSPELKVNISVG